MLNRSALGVSLIAVMALAIACQRDAGLTTNLSVRAALSSASSDIVLVQVTAEQGGETQRVVLDPGADTATLTLKVDVPATITGTVFTFDPARWRSFTTFETLTPQVGSSDVELNLGEEAPVTGSLVPTLAVHGLPANVVNEPLVITMHDVDTDFQAETPFTTGSIIQIPAGRAVVFSVPDRFSGSIAERSLDTSQFADETQIALAGNATIGIAGDDLPALINALTPLAGNDLGLQCAVDGDCASGNFVACSPSTITLETERSYQVSVRYSDVPGSCETTRVVRDLTPPAISTTWSPPVIQPALTALTLDIVADEFIDPASIVVTSGGPTNRCTPAQVTRSEVKCAVDLAGLDLSTDLLLQIQVSDISGETTTRGVTIHVRDSNPVQVIGLRQYPDRANIMTGSVIVGITLAAFDGKGLCGIDTSTYTFTGANPQVSFQSYTGTAWTGPTFAPAHADGSPLVVTYWTRVYLYGTGPLTSGTYVGSGTVPVLACDSRTAQSLALSGSIDVVETGPKWITPGPLTISALATGGFNTLPIAALAPSGDGSPSPDTVTSSDPTILYSLFATGQGYPAMKGLKPGTVRLTATSTGRLDPANNLSVDIDAEVVTPPDILAVQPGRLVRRGHSSDQVTPLPTEIGDVMRVLWESEREEVIVIGTHGVWAQDASGAPHTILDPCGGDDVADGAFTASAPAHAGSMRDLALLVHKGQQVHHCEVDLTALTTTFDVPIQSCAVTKLWGDSHTGQFFAAGDTCALTYVAGATAATTLQSTTFTTTGPLTQLAADEHAALAVILAGDEVFGFNLFGPLTAHPFNLARTTTGLTFTPTAIAIDPMSGTPMVAGQGNDNQATIGEPASVYKGFTDHLGAEPSYVDVARLDPVAYIPPTRVLFDTATASLYSSHPGDLVQQGIAAAMVVLDPSYFNGFSLVDPLARTIRAWPDGLDVIDMVMAGPQPTNMSTASADVGQTVTITGSGFNGAGRDQVYVLGVPAQVKTSTRDSVTFVMPQAMRAKTLDTLSSNLVPVAVRSSGMLSDAVPMAYNANGIEVPAIMPGSYISSYIYGTQACVSGCSAGMEMVDTLGSEGILEVRAPGDSFGVAILDGSANQSISSTGFYAPLRVPGPRRAVGYSGTSLYDVFPPAFNETPTQSYTPVRSFDITQTVSAIAASPDGHVIAVADASGIDFRWAGSFVAHPAARVSVASTAKLAMTSKNLVVAATATGAVSAVRFSDTASALVTVAADPSACPSGPRSEVLAIASDVAQGDVLMVSRYGVALATEVVHDDGTNVTQQCVASGSTTSIITGAINASAIDRSGSRVVLVSGTAAFVYDTADLTLPLSQAPLATGIENVFLGESGGNLVFYGPTTYYPQPLYEQ